MNIPADIHTHRLPALPGEAIVNSYPETFAPVPGGWYSVGVHPWYITPETDTPPFVTPELASRLQSLSALARHPQVVAIGEAGLDKLASASMSLQQQVFGYHVLLAMELRKPLIIHQVRSADNLLKTKKLLSPANPWIIHGFRGKAPLAQQFLRHGCYLSFGAKYSDDALRSVPLDRLFLETDDSPQSICELYERAAQVRGISPASLRQIVEENVANVFFKR